MHLSVNLCARVYGGAALVVTVDVTEWPPGERMVERRWESMFTTDVEQIVDEAGDEFASYLSRALVAALDMAWISEGAGAAWRPDSPRRSS